MKPENMSYIDGRYVAAKYNLSLSNRMSHISLYMIITFTKIIKVK